MLQNKEIKKVRLLPAEYASFRKEIVAYIAGNLLPRAKTVLDPMCGSAPVLPYAEKSGVFAYYNDFMPIHYYVNRAKPYKVYSTIRKYEKKKTNFIFNELLHCMHPLRDVQLLISENWIHDMIQEGLEKAWRLTDNYEDSLSHFFKALIVLSVRPYSSVTSSKNTTWVKQGGISSEKNLETIIKEKIKLFYQFYETFYKNISQPKISEPIFSIGDAATLAFDRKFDLIYTSPSYCNRTDYERLYAPELYFLRSVTAHTNTTKILGTNVVKDYFALDEDLDYITRMAPKTADFLQRTKAKKKKDTYYYMRYFTQYYANLYRIFQNCLDLLSDSGAMYIVVQNNIHRGEMNEMDVYAGEFFSHQGLSVRTIAQYLRTHQGKRNISADYPLVIQRHYESILEVKKC